MSVCPARAVLGLRVKEVGPPPSMGSWQGAHGRVYAWETWGMGLGSGHQLLPSEGPEASLLCLIHFPVHKGKTEFCRRRGTLCEAAAA